MAIASRFADVEIPDQTLPQFALDSVMMSRTLEFAVAYHGALTTGGVVTKLHLMATLGQAAAQLAANHAHCSPDWSTSTSSEGAR